MWLINNLSLTVAPGSVVLLSLPILLIFSYVGPRFEQQRILLIASAFWLAAASFEYYFLGPNSFIASVSDSYFLSFLHFSATLESGSKFTHLMGGGQDIGLIVSSETLFLPDRFLIMFLDPWLVLLGHKLTILVLGMGGSYLLAHRILVNLKVENVRLIAFSVASLYPFCHPYLIDYTVEFGTGFAGIPFAVYAILSTNVSRARYIGLVVLAILVIAFGQPMKTLPAFALATLSVGVLLNEGRWVTIGLSFIACSLASVINWAESINTISLLAPYTARGWDAASPTASGPWTELPILAINKLLSMKATVGALAIAIACMLFTKNLLLYRAILSLIVLVIAYLIIALFPWEWVAMPFLNRVEHGYTLLALNVVTIPILAATISGCRIWHAAPFKLHGAYVALSIGIAAMISVKILHAAYFLALGGQASIVAHDNLKHLEIPTQTPVRIVTLMDKPHPGVMSGFYKFESFDGNILLNIKAWNDYWQAITRKDITAGRWRTRPSVDWQFWYGQAYAIESNLDIELLRRANVGYIISALPLSGTKLRELIAVDRSEWPNLRREDFSSLRKYLETRAERIFNPGRHHVYAIKNPVQRLRPAKSMVIVPDNAGTEIILTELRRNNDNVAIVRASDASKIDISPNLTLSSISVVKDGYDLHVEAPSSGFLLVNNTHLPFWKAYVNGVATEIVPVNLIEMGVVIPKGGGNITLRYQRPSIIQRLAGKNKGTRCTTTTLP